MAKNDTPGADHDIDDGSQAWHLTDVITRLRRVLRSSVRTDYPWETMPMAQVEILQRLSEEPGLGVSELAQRQRLATNTVSTLIHQMVHVGLVTRAPDRADRRAVVLRLTGLGRTNLAGWRRANHERVTAALEQLTAGERRSITAALPALVALSERLEQGERDARVDTDAPERGRSGKD